MVRAPRPQREKWQWFRCPSGERAMDARRRGSFTRSIELGPQQQALGWVQFMLRRESSRRPSLDVIALTLLNSPHSVSAVS